jgi:hypothetical protein
MHTMNGVNVELTTRTGLVNDGRVYVYVDGECRLRFVYMLHVTYSYKYRLYILDKSHLP